MTKKTKLSENANIYQKREDQSEKEKLKDMTFKQKIEYIWEYYKLHGLAILLAIALIIYIIYEIVTPNIIPQLHVAIINNPIQQEALDITKEDMTSILNLDRKSQSVELNTVFNYLGNNDYSMNMRTVFLTRVMAEEIDIVIAPESEFVNYAYKGFMYPLADFLPTDLYSILTDSFYVTTAEDDPVETAYGIYLGDTKLFNGIHDSEDPYILGIIGNTNHIDNSIEFIRYLFQ